MANERSKSSVLDEASDEVDHAILHFFFLLLLNLVCENLHSRSGQARYDLTNSKVTVIPESYRVCSSRLTDSAI